MVGQGCTMLRLQDMIIGQGCRIELQDRIIGQGCTGLQDKIVGQDGRIGLQDMIVCRIGLQDRIGRQGCTVGQDCMKGLYDRIVGVGQVCRIELEVRVVQYHTACRIESKEVCHKIFSLHFFHDSNPFEPLIKRSKVFQNLVSISPSIFYHKVVSVNHHIILQIFSFMIQQMCSSLKGYLRSVSLKATMDTKEDLDFVSAVHTVCCTQRRLSPQQVAHCGDCRRGVLHTAEIITAVGCTQPRFFQNFELLTPN